MTIPLYAKPLQLGLLVAAALTFLCEKATAQAPIDLGQATSFAVLAGAGITFAGPPISTDITGDIGSYSTATITGLEKVILVGVNHAGDTTTQQAKTDLALAYTSASTLSATTTSTTLDLGSETRAPGVYQATTTIGLSGTLTLDAGGDPAAVWVFQAGTALTTATSSKIVLLNGAKASNIFWTIGSSATLGTYTEFAGTVMAYTSITLTTGVIMNGQALALNGAVSLDQVRKVTAPKFLLGKAITGTVFRDTPLVGTFEPLTDAKLSGITVKLYSDSSFTTEIDSTSTNGSGLYSFNNLSDGTYYVKVITAGLPNDVNTMPTVDPDVAKDSQATATVAAGGTSANNNFGYQNTGAITGTVFRDLPTIGSFQTFTDPKLSSVTVNLYSDSGFTTLITSTTTNGSGVYSFANLINGTYYVSVDTTSLPVDVNTTPTVDPDVTKDSRTTATVAAGGTSAGNNFGYKNLISPEIAVKGPSPTNPELVDGTSTVNIGESNKCHVITGTFTVRNDGTDNLSISGITLDGVDSAHFAITTAPAAYPAAIAPGANIQVSISFSAELDDLYTAALHILSNDADEGSFDIALNGTGVNRFFTASGPAVKDGTLLTVTGANYVATNHYFASTYYNVAIELGFAPVAGDKFTAIAIDPGFSIIGNFFDMPQNGVVALGYQGVIYYFIADYAGGDGNDLVLTNFAPSAPPAWTWLAGPKARNNLGRYTGIPLNPGARQGATHFKHPNGNLWSFGGYGYGAVYKSKPWYLSDLWEYNKSTGIWRFVKGSTDVNALGVYGVKGTPDVLNTPGSRHSASSWVACDNHFWVFGGLGSKTLTGSTIGRHNDLWTFNPDTEEWTWKHGSNLFDQPGVYGTLGVSDPANTPGARQGAATWISDCEIWLFGGTTDGGVTFHNDLWHYSIYGGEWTWMGGPNTTSADDRAAAHGTYGTKGVGSVNNIPGARRDPTTWMTPDKFWLFGGTGFGAPGTTTVGPNGVTKDTGDTNDLWYYQLSTGKWTWVSGTNGLDIAGTYGAPAMPGARSAAASWTTADDKLWLCGGLLGSGPQILTNGPQMNDIWTYDPSNDFWSYRSGSQSGGTSGTYGTLGLKDASNHPSGRWTIGTMTSPNGAQWFFGGGGLDQFGGFGRNSDLWSYGITLPIHTPPAPPTMPFPDALIINADPTTNNEAASTMAYATTNGQVTGKDADGDIILFSTTGTTLSHGTLTLQSNGQWTYTPAPGFVGTDTFTFKASDYYGGQSPTRTLTVTVTTNPADADNDGIPDSYEQSTFGSTGADTLGDADGDGQSNYFEYLAGTNPVNAGQNLTTTPTIAAGAGSNGGSFKLDLSHVRPGVSYHLETSSDMDVWNRIGTFTFSVSGSAAIEDPTAPTGQPAFYRVSLEAASGLLP